MLFVGIIGFLGALPANTSGSLARRRHYGQGSGETMSWIYVGYQSSNIQKELDCVIDVGFIMVIFNLFV